VEDLEEEEVAAVVEAVVVEEEGAWLVMSDTRRVETLVAVEVMVTLAAEAMEVVAVEDTAAEVEAAAVEEVLVVLGKLEVNKGFSLLIAKLFSYNICFITYSIRI
jgi:hypothetical protein